MSTPETNPHPMVDRTAEAPPIEAPKTRRDRFRVLSLRHRTRRSRMWLVLSAVLVFIIGGYFLLRYFGSYESTDDAQVDVHLYPVSGRISGYVTKVNVNDNQWVEQGTVLVEIDPRDYQVAVDKAKADLASAEATARSLNITVPVTSVSTSSQLSFAPSDVENARAVIAAAEEQLDAAHAQREYGCGGGDIAARLSERLGWKLWDELLTCEIARLSNCKQSEVESREERLDPLYYRLFKSIMRGSFEGSLNVHRLKLLDADSILHITEHVTQKAAAEGRCVIVGRGSQHFLRHRDDTLRIFLYAPREVKIDRLIGEGLNEKDAEESVDSVDSERAAFIEKYFHMKWPNPPVYHAMLNTIVGVEGIIDSILGFKKTLEQRTRAMA